MQFRKVKIFFKAAYNILKHIFSECVVLSSIKFKIPMVIEFKNYYEMNKSLNQDTLADSSDLPEYPNSSELYQNQDMAPLEVKYENKSDIKNEPSDDGATVPVLEPVLEPESTNVLVKNTEVSKHMVTITKKLERMLYAEACDAKEKIYVIRSVDAPESVKDCLVKYEMSHVDRVQEYLNLVKNEENACMFKELLTDIVEMLDVETDAVSYDEKIRYEAARLAELYKKTGYDKNVLNLYNELMDFIDEKKNTCNILFLEDTTNPRWEALSTSSYQVMPYKDRILNEVQSLEELDASLDRIDLLYKRDLSIKNLELIHLPKPNADFSIYRDATTGLEYARLYNGEWQINPISEDD